MVKEVFILLLVNVFFYLIFTFFSNFRNKYFCTVCASVFSTWLLFLILNYFGYFTNKVILAILIGASASGVFNLLKEKLGLFKFPFILTLFYFGYFLLTRELDFYNVAILIFLWLVFLILFFVYKKQNFKYFLKILDCCKNW